MAFENMRPFIVQVVINKVWADGTKIKLPVYQMSHSVINQGVIAKILRQTPDRAEAAERIRALYQAFEVAVNDEPYLPYRDAFEYTFTERGAYLLKFRGPLGSLQMRDSIDGRGSEYVSCELDEYDERADYWFSDVLQWGDVGWVHTSSMFQGCRKLNISAQDVPDLSGVDDVSHMFSEAFSMNAPIGHWDMTHVVNMWGIFDNARSFNQPLESWNTQNVTNMSSLFHGAESFNQPLEKWNTGKVTNMTGMFYKAKAFNQPLEKWDVSHVESMSDMFNGAEAFDQPLEAWNVGNVTDMSFMFEDAKKFNQPLAKWNTSRVTRTNLMFNGAERFDQPLENWDVSHVEDFFGMFEEAVSFNQPLEKWDVGNGKEFRNMFRGAKRFNQPLNAWNMSRAERVGGMFADTDQFDQPRDKWDMSHVDSMNDMFHGAKKFNQPLEAWDTHNVECMSYMFADTECFNQPLEAWDIRHVTSMDGMFSGAKAFKQSLAKWRIDRVIEIDHIFDGAENFNISLNHWKPAGIFVLMANLIFDGVRFPEQVIAFWKEIRPVFYVLSLTGYVCATTFAMNGKRYHTFASMNLIPDEICRLILETAGNDWYRLSDYFTFLNRPLGSPEFGKPIYAIGAWEHNSNFNDTLRDFSWRSNDAVFIWEGIIQDDNITFIEAAPEEISEERTDGVKREQDTDDDGFWM